MTFAEIKRLFVSPAIIIVDNKVMSLASCKYNDREVTEIRAANSGNIIVELK